MTTTTTTTTEIPQPVESPIRERIITAIKTKLQEISTSNGYLTNIGATEVHRGRTIFNQGETECISIFPGVETTTYDTGRRRLNEMPVIIVSSTSYSASTENASEEMEKMLADLIHNIVGRIFTTTFSNGSAQISQGDRIIGTQSTASAIVQSISVSSGSWGAGNAAGTLTIRDVREDFLQGENIKINDQVIAILSGSQTIQQQYDGLVSWVEYSNGGPEIYPSVEETICSVSCTFNFHYPTKIDNPYIN